jgi:hypothetical protein
MLKIIHTPTIEDYIEVVSWAFEKDMDWCAGPRNTNTSYWNSYKSETCIMIRGNKEISFCDRENVYIKIKHHNILSMHQFHLNKYGLK